MRTKLAILSILIILIGQWLIRRTRQTQSNRADRKFHPVRPNEMHCPTCWRTQEDLMQEGKFKIHQGYAQCGHHYADLDYGELPSEEVAANRRALDIALSDLE